MAIDVFSVCFWWYAFGIPAVDPVNAAAVSIMNWVTSWTYVFTISMHPVGCRLRHSPIYGQWATLAIAAFTLVHFTATCWALAAKSHDSFEPLWGHGTTFQTHPRYDCEQADVLAAPSNSSCSVEQICGMRGLYVDPGFDTGEALMVPRLFGVIFVGFAIGLVPGIYSALADSPFIRKGVPCCRFRISQKWVFTICLLGLVIAALMTALSDPANYFPKNSDPGHWNQSWCLIGPAKLLM
jgi:hypothetical protein